RGGVSVITSGDHIWDQKETLSFIDTEPRLLRPVNYPDGTPGAGSIVLETAKGKIGVINVQARTFMQPILDNPFRAIEAAVAKIRTETPNIIVDAHGETTSEKIALVRLRGALIEIDETTGRALRISRLDEPGPVASKASEPPPRGDIELAPSPEQT